MFGIEMARNGNLPWESWEAGFRTEEEARAHLRRHMRLNRSQRLRDSRIFRLVEYRRVAATQSMPDEERASGCDVLQLEPLAPGEEL